MVESKLTWKVKAARPCATLTPDHHPKKAKAHTSAALRIKCRTRDKTALHQGLTRAFPTQRTAILFYKIIHFIMFNYIQAHNHTYPHL